MSPFGKRGGKGRARVPSSRTFQCLTLVMLILIIGFVMYDVLEADDDRERTWTSDFNMESRNFSSTGNSTYFIMQVGWCIELHGVDGGDEVNISVEVLNETVDIGGVECRVIVENETVNGELYESTRDYFAFCTNDSSIFYFGEDVDYYENGAVVGHEGGWLANGTGNHAGMLIPGWPLLGARFYQEYAPGVAMDRAEVIGLNETLVTPAGTFEGCLRIAEENPLEGGTDRKTYAPGIGIIQDEVFLLVSCGFR